MKILALGNCQVETVMTALGFFNPDCEFLYAGNSNRVRNYDPDRLEEQLHWCDAVLTQPVFNPANPFFHEALRPRLPQAAVFMPYVYLDGYYTLNIGNPAADGLGGVPQAAILEPLLAEHGAKDVARRFRRDEIDFDQPGRLARSLADLRRREAVCDVQVADWMEERLTTLPRIVLTHRHPHPALIDQIAAQAAQRMGLAYSPITMAHIGRFSAITLPVKEGVISPYAARDLKLEFGYDLDWARQGGLLIQRVASAMERLGEAPRKGLFKDDFLTENDAERVDPPEDWDHGGGLYPRPAAAQ